MKALRPRSAFIVRRALPANIALVLLPCLASAIDPTLAGPVLNPFGLGDIGSRAFLELADINADGDLDAFFGESIGDIVYYENTGSSTSPAFAASSLNPFGLTDVGANTVIEFGDIDGDGDLDAMIGADGGIVSFFVNTGNLVSPSFAAAVANPFGIAPLANFLSPELVDINGDGDLDLFMTSYDTYHRFFENTGNSGSPSFAAPVTSPFGLLSVVQPFSSCFADLDYDGDLDELSGRLDGRPHFQRNSGTPLSPAFSGIVANPFGMTIFSNRAAPCMADIDGDRDMDIFLSNNDGNTRFYQNTVSLPAPSITGDIIRLDPANTDDMGARFQITFSEPVTPTFTPSDIQLTGTLNANALCILPSLSGDPVYTVFVVAKYPAANGTLGIRINGTVLNASGNSLAIPLYSPYYTIANNPPGDVSKNGVFDLVDVALLADANLGLAVLP